MLYVLRHRNHFLRIKNDNGREKLKTILDYSGKMRSAVRTYQI